MIRNASLIALLIVSGCSEADLHRRATLPNYQPPLQNLPTSHDVQPRNSLPP